jgi:hypothetical protein
MSFHSGTADVSQELWNTKQEWYSLCSNDRSFVASINIKEKFSNKCLSHLLYGCGACLITVRQDQSVKAKRTLHI